MSDSFIKKIELGIRGYLNRRIRGHREPVVILDSAYGMQLGIDLGDNPRILFLRQDRIGDLLVSTGIIAAVRKTYPGAHIDVLLGTNNYGVRHALDGLADDVILYEKGVLNLRRIISKIRSNNYTVVVDLTDNASTTSSLLVSRAHARYALGVDKVNRNAYTHVVPMADRSSVNIVDRIGRLLWFFGIDDTSVNLRPVYPVSPSDTDRAACVLDLDRSMTNIGLNISGSGEARMYTEEGWVEVVRTLTGIDGICTYILSNTSPDHIEQARRIAESTGARYAPSTKSFHEFASMISLFDGVITPDTSVVHLTAAFNQPSVVLFLHDNPTLLPWYPYGTSCHACSAMSGSIKNIPVDAVTHQVHELLQEIR